jgi:hypothetical protein
MVEKISSHDEDLVLFCWAVHFVIGHHLFFTLNILAAVDDMSVNDRFKKTVVFDLELVGHLQVLAPHQERYGFAHHVYIETTFL